MTNKPLLALFVDVATNPQVKGVRVSYYHAAIEYQGEVYYASLLPTPPEVGPARYYYNAATTRECGARATGWYAPRYRSQKDSIITELSERIIKTMLPRGRELPLWHTLQVDEDTAPHIQASEVIVRMHGFAPIQKEM